MKDQLRYLIELQTFDSKIQEMQGAISALPAKIAPDKENLAKLEGLLRAEKDELEKTETWRREQELVLKQEEDAIRKAKLKLQSSSSTKEFAAANRELEHKRRSVSEREEEILKIITAIEASGKSIEAHEADVQTLRDTVGTEDAEVSEKVAALQVQVDADMGGRAVLVAQLDKKLLARYAHVQKRRGIAVVEIVQGGCRGCHMSIPPQLANILAGCDTIEACPYCHRLIYTAAMLGESAEGDEAAPAEQAAE